MNNKVQKQLLGQLLDQLQKRWQQYESKYHQMMAELRRDLDELRTVYGDETVSTLLNSSNLTIGFSSGAKRATLKPINGDAPVSRRARRRRRKPLANKEQLNFKDTEKQVLAKLKEMKPHSPFTSRELLKALQRDGHKVVADYVSVTLSQRVRGVKKVGTTPRDKRGGPPLNLYELETKAPELKVRR